MANNEEIKIRITAEDRASGVLSNIGSNASKLQGVFKGMTALGISGFAGLTAGLYKSAEGAAEAERIQTRLAQILRTTVNASDDQIKSLSDQAEALERVGVVSADVIRQGQGQLASFDLQTKSIEKLIPSILNYAVAEKGLNMTTEDLQATTNGLAQALQGNFASLTRSGFVLDDATKALISNGDETERVAALTKILDSTYEGMNETMRKTTAGGVLGLKFELGKLMDTIGNGLIPVVVKLTERLLPIVEKVTQWIEKNPELTMTIIAVTAGLFGLMTIVGAVGLAIPTLTIGVTALGAAFAFVAANPLVLLVAALGLMLIKLKSAMDEVGGAKIFFQQTWDGIKIIFGQAIDWINNKIDELISKIQSAMASLNSVAQKVPGSGGLGFTNKIGDWITGRAVGGPVPAGQSFLVGERGPEIFTPGSSGNIIPNNKLMGMGGGNINININGAIFTEDAAERMGNVIIDRLKLDLRM